VLERGVIELDGHLSGTLRIAASTTIAQYILPPLLGAFLRLHPAVRVELDSSNTESVADRYRPRRPRPGGGPAALEFVYTAISITFALLLGSLLGAASPSTFHSLT